jgi:hypothetical protein
MTLKNTSERQIQMNYELKDKITISKEFISELEAKSWQEVEQLQAQIANIEVTAESTKVIQLLKNLLTSYYVFVGELENLNDEDKAPKVTEFTCQDKEPIPTAPVEEASAKEVFDEADDFFDEQINGESTTDEVFEPFEYFVDFDEPIGEPLTDDDIYNN